MSSSSDAYHHGDLARALESAAMQLLERLPAADVSLREVARAANVSHNAPYHHFSDRRGLLKVLAERSMADLNAAVRAGAAEAADSNVSLRQAGAAYIRFAVERANAFNVIYDPTVCVPGSPTPTMAPLIFELEGILGSSAAATGRTSAGEIAALWGVVHGLGTLAAAGHLTLDQALDAWSTVVAVSPA